MHHIPGKWGLNTMHPIAENGCWTPCVEFLGMGGRGL